MTKRYEKRIRDRKERFKLGFKRTVQFWNPFLKHKYRKRIRHNQAVLHSTPFYLNIIIGSIVVVLFYLKITNNYILSNDPLVFATLVFSIVFLFIIECWYAGSDEYIKYKNL